MKSSIQKHLFNPTLENGNNYLHDMIINCSSSSDIEKIKFYIRKIGFENARQMTQQQNDRGELPFDLINTLNIEEKDKNTLKKIIMPSLLASDVSGLSIKLSSKTVLNEYKVKPSSPLGKNLIIACEVINKTRELITRSETHPSTNQDSKKDRNEKYHIITENRQKIQQLKKEYTSKQQDQLLEKIVSVIESGGAGNCYEYSMIAKKLSNNKSAIVCEITKGDHTILWIDPTSEHGVICDAWAGRALPIGEIAKLSIHRQVDDNGTIKHYTAAFHPKLNHFKQIFPIVPEKPILEIKQSKEPLKQYYSLAPQTIFGSLKPKKCFSTERERIRINNRIFNNPHRGFK